MMVYYNHEFINTLHNQKRITARRSIRRVDGFSVRFVRLEGLLVGVYQFKDALWRCSLKLYYFRIVHCECARTQIICVSEWGFLVMDKNHLLNQQLLNSWIAYLVSSTMGWSVWPFSSEQVLLSPRVCLFSRTYWYCPTQSPSSARQNNYSPWRLPPPQCHIPYQDVNPTFGGLLTYTTHRAFAGCTVFFLNNFIFEKGKVGIGNWLLLLIIIGEG